MTSHNLITLMGRVGRPKKIVFTKQSGEISGEIITLHIMTFGRNEEHWHQIEIEGKRQIDYLIANSVRSGSIIQVTGFLGYKKWTDPDGKQKTKPVIFVSSNHEVKYIAPSKKALDLAKKTLEKEIEDTPIDIEEQLEDQLANDEGKMTSAEEIEVETETKEQNND